MKDVKSLVRHAIVAAIYVVLTIYNPFSYETIQFRVSEMLILLVFFRKDYAWSLIVGCMIANAFSPFGILDVVFGTTATALATLGIMHSKRLWLATLYPVILNGLIIGLLLYLVPQYPFWISAAWVALGEFVVVSVFGYILFKQLAKRPGFLEFIGANQNLPQQKYEQ